MTQLGLIRLGKGKKVKKKKKDRTPENNVKTESGGESRALPLWIESRWKGGADPTRFRFWIQGPQRAHSGRANIWGKTSGNPSSLFAAVNNAFGIPFGNAAPL